MCGIAGYTTLFSDSQATPEYIENMLAALHHRGPDDRGWEDYGDVILGNTRLSIIDLAGGHQPIDNEDGSISIVYNGELYNSPALREELIKKGHVFKTQTDTEVLVHLYEEEGEDFLKRLNGIFGLALYDKNKKVLIIARDRYGVKPVFYIKDPKNLVFASEIKALRKHYAFNGEHSDEGLSVFLGLFYIPEPWTAYKNVKKLRPGHFLRVTPDGVTEHEYFDLDFSSKRSISRNAAEDELALLVRPSC